MGKIMHSKIKGMSWKAKTALISLFSLLLTVGIYQVRWQDAQAAIANPQAWSSIYAGTAFPAAAGYPYTVNAGADRLLVVAVQSSVTAAATQACTVTWGGKTLTQATGDGTVSRQAHTFLYYLKEADIAAATGTTLIATVTGGTTSYNFVRAAVYTGVYQTAPIKTTAQWTSTTTASTAVGPLSPTLTIAAGEQAVEIVNLTRTGSTTSRTITPATPWTSLLTTASGAGTGTIGVRNYILGDTTAGTGITSSYTANGTTLSSIAAMVITPITISTLTASSTKVAPTGSRLDTDTGIIMQRLQVAGTSASGSMELNSLTLDDIGTANNIAAAYIYISPTPATVLPGDAVLIRTAANWAGTSTVFDLSTIAGTQAARTLTGTTAKYIYIVYDMSAGQATKTIQSTVTAVGVVSPNISAAGLSLSSNTVTLDYSGNRLATSASLTGVTNAKDSDVAAVMQHFKVDCNSAFDNALELNSLTIEELGTTAQVSAVKVYVSTPEEADQTKLPAKAIQVGQITDWNKDSTVVPLNNDFGATASDRTVLAGTSKYLYVVYSMYYPDDADFVAGKTVQSKVTAVGTASPDTGETGLSYLSNSITLTRGTWSRITSCGGCHDTANIYDEPGGRNSKTLYNREGRFPGSHYVHSNKYAFDCSNCHQKPTVYNHANGVINFSGLLSSDKYSLSGKNGDPSDTKKVSNVSNFGSCNNTTCHGDTSPVWGVAMPADCTGCHGTKSTDATPTTLSGLHDRHLNSVNNPLLGTGLNCIDCHNATVTNNTTISTTGKVMHLNGVADYAGTLAGNYVNATKTCSSVYCHSYGLVDAANVFVNPVVWTSSGTLLSCNGCHGTSNAAGSPHYTNGGPATATSNNHPAHFNKDGITCQSCHKDTVDGVGSILSGSTTHVNKVKDVSFVTVASYTALTKTCSNVACHGSGTNSATWGSLGGCGICHAISTLSGAHKFHVYTSATFTPTAYDSSLILNKTLSTRKDYNFGCANCHPVLPNNHKKGTVLVDVAKGEAATVGLLRSLNGVNAAYDTTTKKCSSNYCHSNGGTGTQVALTYYDSPPWNTTYTGDKCAMCHGNSPNSGGKSGSPAHYNTAWLGFENNSSGHGIGIHSKSIYAGLNGATSYANGSLVAGAGAANNHGNTSASTTISCNVCHNSVITNAANDHNNLCASCHNGSTAGLKNPAGDDMNLIANPSMHVNGSVEVQFAMTGFKTKAQVQDNNFTLYSTSWTRTNGYKASGGTSYELAKVTPAPSYNSADGSCSNIACHNNVRKSVTVLRWSAVNGTTDCVSCHVPQ